MPLGPFESEVLRLLACNRNPDSYVGGATVLHQMPDSPRASADIDVFHDKSVRRRHKNGQQVRQILTETAESHFIWRKNDEIVADDRFIKIIRLRATGIVIRNTHTSKAVQRIDFGRIKNF